MNLVAGGGTELSDWLHWGEMGGHCGSRGCRRRTRVLHSEKVCGVGEYGERVGEIFMPLKEE